MKSILVSIAIVIQKREQEFFLWMQRRSEEGALDGKLEFAGGKIEDNETPVQACIREFKEEVGVELDPGHVSPFKIYPYEYQDRRVTLYAHLVNSATYELESKNYFKLPLESDIEWQKEIPAANVEIINDLKQYLLNQAEFYQYIWK